MSMRLPGFLWDRLIGQVAAKFASERRQLLSAMAKIKVCLATLAYPALHERIEYFV